LLQSRQIIVLGVQLFVHWGNMNPFSSTESCTPT
jgi:hypothetical protein